MWDFHMKLLPAKVNQSSLCWTCSTKFHTPLYLYVKKRKTLVSIYILRVLRTGSYSPVHAHCTEDALTALLPFGQMIYFSTQECGCYIFF